MEESIWIVIGIISVILLFGIIGRVVYTSYQDSITDTSAQNVETLAALCTRVCRMPDETFLSTNVELYKGTIVSANGERICSSYKDKTSCDRCECPLYDYTLDLRTTELFTKHEYECFFRNDKYTINMTCVG